MTSLEGHRTKSSHRAERRSDCFRVCFHLPPLPSGGLVLLHCPSANPLRSVDALVEAAEAKKESQPGGLVISALKALQALQKHLPKNSFQMTLRHRTQPTHHTTRVLHLLKISQAKSSKQICAP